MSTYNNTEFLRIDTLDAGRYGLKVVYDSMVYDTSGLVDEEEFGLAWRAVAIPEPSCLVLLVGGLVCLARRRRDP